MLQTAKIKIRNIKELQADNIDIAESVNTAKTPLRKRKNPRSATTAKKLTLPDERDENKAITNEPLTTVKKRVPKSAKKEPPPWQKPIDAYFKSCQKSYKIEAPLKEDPPPTPIGKNIVEAVTTTTTTTTTKTIKNSKNERATTTTTKRTTRSTNPKRLGRKRLFVEPTLTTAETETNCSYNSNNQKEPTTIKMIECISIDSDTDDENPVEKLKENVNKFELNLQLSSSNHLQNTRNISSLKTPCTTELSATRNISSITLKTKEQLKTISTPVPNPQQSSTSSRSTTKNATKTSATKETLKQTSPTTAPQPFFDQQLSSNTSNDQPKTPPKTSLPNAISATTGSRRKPKPCPPYKIIEGTTFAVDAFQFGYIENITHYFLTHFHADHYIGLTQKFSMPLYMSPITARFVREFIPIDEKYINILELNQPHILDNIEITALDANHCPGAIIIVFKFLQTGKCILHTGDFRAWHGMESEPIFWNNDIHTIYLDTTYISDKYAFCTQHESIDKAKQLIEKFQEKHQGKRILYICGSYVIGKEKFWCALAEEYEFKVWTEGNRYKALKAMEDERLNKLLIADPIEANMHVIPMAKLGYLHLVDYFAEYECHFDIVFAIRPSGWEKDSKPQYRGKINIVGVEYSEHSSYREMQRFVKFLKPQHVLSTVPTGKSLMITAKIPQTWYKYDTLKSSSNYQPTLDSYCQQTPQRKNIRPPKMNKGGLENFISPLSLHKKNQREINNNDGQIKEPQQVISINSSENEFEQALTRKETETEKENEIFVELEEPLTKPEPAKETKIANNSKTPKETNSKRIKKKTTPAKKNAKKSPNSKNENCSIFVTKSFSIANSSEDFQMPEILSTQNKNHPIKQTQHDNSQLNKNGIIKKKLICAETSSTQKSSVVKDSKRNYQKQISKSTASEKEFEITQSQKTIIARNSKQNGNSKNKANEKQKSLNTTSEEDTEIHISQTSKRKISNRILNSQVKEIEREKSLIITSESDIEIPVSQKTRRKISTATNSTKPSQILEQKQIKAKKQNIELTTFQTRHNKSRKNPIHKSATTSNTIVNSNDEIPTTSTLRLEEYSPKPLRDTVKPLKTPPPYIPTPITKQNFKASLISPSISKLTTNPLLKSTTTSNYSSSTEEIPPSQTTLQQVYTPRPLRNKRNALTPSIAYNPTPIKKSKDLPSANNNFTPTAISPQTVTDILQNHTDLDFYNHSQLSVIVEETLDKQCHDNNTDHIPSELLSDPDADDDWM